MSSSDILFMSIALLAAITLITIILNLQVQVEKKVQEAVNNTINKTSCVVLKECDWDYRNIFKGLRIVRYDFMGEVPYYQVQGEITKGRWSHSFKIQNGKPNFSSLSLNKLLSYNEAIRIYTTLKKYSQNGK